MQYLKDVSIYFPENTVKGSEKVTVSVTGQMLHLYLKINHTMNLKEMETNRKTNNFQCFKVMVQQESLIISFCKNKKNKLE